MTPIIIPTVINGSGGISGLVAVMIVLVMLLLSYYLWIIIALCQLGDYRTKKEFIRDLVPFRSWVRAVSKKWKSLK